MSLKSRDIVILFVACLFLKCSSIEYSYKRILTVQIMSKIDKYDPILDSSIIGDFRKVYRSVIGKILNDSSDNMFIAERIISLNNKFTIDFFYSYEKGKRNSIRVATNNKDSIFFNEFTLKYTLPKLSSACNQQYFYYNKSIIPEGYYASYSIFIIKDGKLTDTKIFFSEKFDKFNNTVCTCNDKNLKDIILFINSLPSPNSPNM